MNKRTINIFLLLILRRTTPNIRQSTHTHTYKNRSEIIFGVAVWHYKLMSWNTSLRWPLYYCVIHTIHVEYLSNTWKWQYIYSVQEMNHTKTFAPNNWNYSYLTSFSWHFIMFRSFEANTCSIVARISIKCWLRVKSTRRKKWNIETMTKLQLESQVRIMMIDDRHNDSKRMIQCC